MLNYSSGKKLSLCWLKRHGYFKEPKLGEITWEEGVWAKKSNLVNDTIYAQIPNGHPYLTLGYVIEDKKGSRKQIHYEIPLVKKPCYFGGYRHFFVCCLESCKRRATVLYKPEYGTYFACRICHKIRYLGQVVNQRYRHRKEVRNARIEGRINRLEEVQVRRHYRGKITKRAKKLDRLYSKVDIS